MARGRPNKPIYPLYVWWFVGSGTAVAWATALSAPLFLAVALSAARRPLATRVALPLVGGADTVFATVLFGPASGSELFFVPCLLLAITVFSAHEGRWTRGLVAVLFVPFVIAHATIGSGVAPWTAAETAHIKEIDVFAVASLSAFPGWRFSGTGGDA